MNHTERIAYIARQDRHLTQNVVADVLERYLDTLIEDLAAGEWVELPGIGKVQVTLEKASGTLYSIREDGSRAVRKPTMRLRTKVRLSQKFKQQCRSRAPIPD